MRGAVIRAIVRKDVANVVRNRGVRIPLLIMPFLLLVVLPTLLVGAGEILAAAGTMPADAVARSPLGSVAGESLQSQVDAGVPARARWTVFVLEVMLAPLFLLIPLVVASVIAADSFAGERERGTLEALLHSPTTDRELLSAKFLTAWLPSLTVTWGSFLIYSLLANVLGWPSMGRVFFPSATWIVLALWVAPALSALGLAVMVIASSRVRTLQAAHQLGSLVVLPIVLLLVLQLSGTVLLDVRSSIWSGGILWLLALSAIRLGGSSLRRSSLAERL